MNHLGPDTLEAALKGDPRGLSFFTQHLAGPCAECEAFLLEHDLGPLLEGEVDRVLFRATGAGDDAGYARVQRGLRPSRLRELSAVALGLAASLALVTVLRPTLPKDLPSTKGGALVQVELSAAARAKDGSVRRLEPGGPIAPGEVLLLRYHATEAVTALLVEQVPGGPARAVGAFALQPGTQDLTQNGALAGVAVDNEVGAATLALVAGVRGAPTLADAVRALDTSDHDGWTVARFPFRVEARHHPDSP